MCGVDGRGEAWQGEHKERAIKLAQVRDDGV